MPSSQSTPEWERRLFIMRQRRWMRLVKRGDWEAMVQHVRAIKDYDARKEADCG